MIKSKDISLVHAWMIKKFVLAPKTIERKGVSKGKRFPMTNKKMTFCFLKAFAPDKMKLKEFAEHYSLPYGTVRNWSISLDVKAEVMKIKREYELMCLRDELRILINDIHKDKDKVFSNA